MLPVPTASLPNRRLKIVVLAGGPGAERTVSQRSGAAIAAALRAAGHTVVLRDITPDDPHALEQDADVFFPALHGVFGEDGALQRLLAARGVPFVGADEKTSALCFDKVACKRAVSSLGLSTPAHQVVSADDLAADTLGSTLPAVVKPVAEGSSIATTIVQTATELQTAVCDVVQDYGHALIEAFIAGDELTVGVVGTTPLPPIWIRPQRTFYDYKAKYEDDATEYCFDLKLDAAASAALQQGSLRICRTLGCRHLARVDWIIDADGRPWFLEVNTLPGFTDHSLLPKAAARHGWSFTELVERLVWMAVEEGPWREPKKQAAAASGAATPR